LQAAHLYVDDLAHVLPLEAVEVVTHGIPILMQQD
jgi:hypothetical protein